MAYTTIDNPELYFQVKIWSGDGGTTQAITLDGSEDMAPNLVYAKGRSLTSPNLLFDSIRGANEALVANNTNAEATVTGYLNSFDSDGFTVGNDGAVNGGSDTYVAWCWKAGTSFSNDASATSIGTHDSSGSVNNDAGFSIVSWTGTGSTNGSVKHGLSTKPDLVIEKRRDSGDSWFTWHKTLTDGGYYLLVNTTAAQADGAAGIWNDTEPTTSIFNIGNNTAVNASGGTYIAYCFTGKQGFSKFGSYTGNGNADGTYVHLGFRPAMVILKKTNGTGKWFVQDNKRDGYNATYKSMIANTDGAEDTNSTALSIDYLSNGFKLRNSYSELNGSGDTMIYMAFAEAPFVNSNGVPCNAR